MGLQKRSGVRNGGYGVLEYVDVALFVAREFVDEVAQAAVREKDEPALLPVFDVPALLRAPPGVHDRDV